MVNKKNADRQKTSHETPVAHLRFDGGLYSSLLQTGNPQYFDFQVKNFSDVLETLVFVHLD